MAAILFLTTLLCLCCDAATTLEYSQSFSWKDYENTVIPSDAFMAGVDKYDKAVYIGQYLYTDKLIPGKIIAGDRNMYFEFFDKEYQTSENIKILCSDGKNLEWIQTSHTELPNLLQRNKRLLHGGFEATCKVYIGRVVTNGATNVGKVMCCIQDGACYGLYTTENSAAKLHETFEVLSYQDDTDISMRGGTKTPNSNSYQCTKELNIAMYL